PATPRKHPPAFPPLTPRRPPPSPLLPYTTLFRSILVALALIPEAIAFSIIAGVDPMVGLYASFIIAVVISFTGGRPAMISEATGDRKSTRLNSSHVSISYAVFCLNKKIHQCLAQE